MVWSWVAFISARVGSDVLPSVPGSGAAVGDAEGVLDVGALVGWGVGDALDAVGVGVLANAGAPATPPPSTNAAAATSAR
jgi:hypothetical protein